METDRPDVSDDQEQIEGLDSEGRSWGDYPLDEMLIRSENRTIHDVVRRIDQGRYVMDPEFQRDFIWPEDKQSKLIESVIMRIPLPVFYLAEEPEGRVVVVDGLQRLSTFDRFVKDKLKLRLPDQSDLNGKSFSELPAKYQNRIEDCSLIVYVIDSKIPERARLDIFERVNSGLPLTRQQMRNSLFTGKATRFLKEEAQSKVFLQATGGSLRTSSMRDREFVNRFCAFQILTAAEYRRDDMDEFLAESLRIMNRQSDEYLSRLGTAFRRGLENNFALFGRHAFRKHTRGQESRGVLNASLWDVMSTGLSHYKKDQVDANADALREAFHGLLEDEEFNTAITYGPNGPRKVRHRFEAAHGMMQEVLGDPRQLRIRRAQLPPDMA